MKESKSPRNALQIRGGRTPDTRTRDSALLPGNKGFFGVTEMPEPGHLYELLEALNIEGGTTLNPEQRQELKDTVARWLKYNRPIPAGLHSDDVEAFNYVHSLRYRVRGQIETQTANSEAYRFMTLVYSPFFILVLASALGKEWMSIIFKSHSTEALIGAALYLGMITALSRMRTVRALESGRINQATLEAIFPEIGEIEAGPQANYRALMED